MNIRKSKIADLTLCYWVTTLVINDEEHFLAASEKEFPCLLFDKYGRQVCKIWDGPGGTMTAVQLPGDEGKDGSFLATHRMYSPNNCKEASIVLCYPEGGEWKVKTLAHMPGVHRFDVITRNGCSYLFACTIKSDYEYKDDWRFPGRVFVCTLPKDLKALPEGEELSFRTIKDGMTKNHGYTRDYQNGIQTAIVSSEEGIFRFTPPDSPDGEWLIDTLSDEPTSDAVMIDFDGDGEKEMLTLSPFHGDTLKIFKLKNKKFEAVYEYPEKLPFLHAICMAEYNSRPAAIIGNRKGNRDLFMVRYTDGKYVIDILDHDVGSANACSEQIDGKTIIVSANREINEVAYYTLE